jgi:hypothetical protein
MTISLYHKKNRGLIFRPGPEGRQWVPWPKAYYFQGPKIFCYTYLLLLKIKKSIIFKERKHTIIKKIYIQGKKI